MDQNESSSSTVNTNVSEQTLQKLASSINQYAASALTGVAIPEFSGAPDDDVHEFLRKFKLATITFSDELRCLALQKALTGAARIWCKTISKGSLAENDWQATKKALIGRFEAPNQSLRHQENLSKLKYDPMRETLTSFVEKYAACYKKAHNKPKDSDIMKSIALKLPKHIIRDLNLLSESWSDITELREFYKLVRRFENKIQPYEQDEDLPGKRLDIAGLKRLLSDLKDSFKQTSKTTEPKMEEQEVALIQQHRGPPNRQNPSGNNCFEASGGENVQSGYTQSTYGPIRINQTRNFQGQYAPYQLQQRNQRGASGRRLLQTNETPKQNIRALQNAYIAKYGAPPGPCQYCGEDHYNRHCIFRDLN